MHAGADGIQAGGKILVTANKPHAPEIPTAKRCPTPPSTPDTIMPPSTPDTIMPPSTPDTVMPRHPRALLQAEALQAAADQLSSQRAAVDTGLKEIEAARKHVDSQLK